MFFKISSGGFDSYMFELGADFYKVRNKCAEELMRCNVHELLSI